MYSRFEYWYLYNSYLFGGKFSQPVFAVQLVSVGVSGVSREHTPHQRLRTYRDLLQPPINDTQTAYA